MLFGIINQLSSAANLPNVANWAALPAAVDNNNAEYVVDGAQGIGVYGKFGNRKPAGVWVSNGTTWDFKGATSDDVGGVKAGGGTGQVYTKLSAADGDADWQDPAGGGGSSPDYLTDGMFQMCLAPTRNIIGGGTQSATNWGFWQTNPDDTRRRYFGPYSRVYTSTTVNSDAGLRLYEVLTPQIGANNLRNGGYMETSFELTNNVLGQQRFFVGLSTNTSTSGTAGSSSITGASGVGLIIDQGIGDTTWYYTHNRNSVTPVRTAFQSAPIAFGQPYLASFEILASNQVTIRLKNLVTGVTYTETITVAWALNFYEFYPQIGIRNLTSLQLNEFQWNKKFMRRPLVSW